MKNQIVILAAGKGTRMGGSMPKVLVMLKHKPLIMYILEQIDKINQLIKPVVVVGFMAEKVKAILGSEYLYAYQDKQLGTAHALMAAKQKVKAENILVLYGDMPFIKADSLKSLIKLHFQKKANISMLTSRVPSFSGQFESINSYGRVVKNKQGKIEKIVELKDASPRQRKLKEVNPGIYMFNTKWLWENIKNIQNANAQGEYYLTDVVQLAVKEGEKIYSLNISPREILGVNSRQDLEIAEKFLTLK